LKPERWGSPLVQDKYHYYYCYFIIIVIIITIILEFLTSQLWLGNIHLSWDVVINRIILGGLICSLKSFLQLNMRQELQIFAVVYMYSGARLSVIVLARLCVFGTVMSIKKVLFVFLFMKVMSGRLKVLYCFIIIIIIIINCIWVVTRGSGYFTCTQNTKLVINKFKLGGLDENHVVATWKLGKGMSGQQHAPAALYTRKRPGTHFTGGWVGPRVGLEGRKISSPPGFDHGPSSP